MITPGPGAATDCVACPDGHICRGGSFPPSACTASAGCYGAGYYAATCADECVLCGAGTYESAGKCVTSSCAWPLYSPSGSGSDTCVRCEDVTHCPVGSSATTSFSGAFKSPNAVHFDMSLSVVFDQTGRHVPELVSGILSNAVLAGNIDTLGPHRDFASGHMPAGLCFVSGDGQLVVSPDGTGITVPFFSVFMAVIMDTGTRPNGWVLVTNAGSTWNGIGVQATDPGTSYLTPPHSPYYFTGKLYNLANTLRTVTLVYKSDGVVGYVDTCNVGTLPINTGSEPGNLVLLGSNAQGGYPFVGVIYEALAFPSDTTLDLTTLQLQLMNKWAQPTQLACRTQAECGPGYKWVGGNCYNCMCPVGTFSGSSPTTECGCELTIPGFYATGGTAPAVGCACAAGKWCPDGYFATSPDNPPPPYYAGVTYASSASAQRCIACPQGYECAGGISMPSACTCPSGTWTRGGQSCPMYNNCAACAEGSYCTGGSAQPITCNGANGPPAGAYCPARTSSSAGQPCTVGNYCTGGNVLKPCSNTLNTVPAGQYCAPGSKTDTGTICPAGNACEGGAQPPQHCTCEAGSWCNAGTAIPGGSCATCAPGSYCTGGAALQTLCTVPAGFYCPGGTKTATDRAACTAQYYCNGNDAIPTLCATKSGYYCPAGMSSRDGVLCPAGMYCSGGVAPAANCTAQPGYACATGSGSPTGSSCPPNQYCTGGSAVARACTAAAGNACQGGSKTSAGESCPAGHTCSGQANAPVACTCPSGSACPPAYFGDGAACPSCPAGYFCVGNDALSMCPAGTYSSLGASSCSPCIDAPGAYCPAGGTSAKGAQCPMGQYCAGAGAVPVNCPAAPGRYCPPGAAAPDATLRCPALYECAGGGAAPAPARCSPGTYGVDPNFLQCELAHCKWTADAPKLSAANGTWSTFWGNSPHVYFWNGTRPAGDSFSVGSSMVASLKDCIKSCKDNSHCTVVSVQSPMPPLLCTLTECLPGNPSAACTPFKVVSGSLEECTFACEDNACNTISVVWPEPPPPTQFGVADTNGCTQCPAGSMCAGGAAAAVNCTASAGSYCPAGAGSATTACDEGSWCGGGTSLPVRCSTPGYICPTGTPSPTAHPCLVGTFWTDGACNGICKARCVCVAGVRGGCAWP